MEGKAILFKGFGGVDAVPICLDTQDTEEIIRIVKALAPGFGGINLEDISAPRCFEIERRLIDELDIPVFHDDQHGTAVVVLAALKNAVRVQDKKLNDLRVVISGAGAAGVAVAKILLAAGAGDVVVLDSRGIVHSGRDDLNSVKRALAAETNRAGLTGGMAEALDGADVLIGVSGGRIAEDGLARLAPGAMIFALANPTPEVHPEVAARYASIVATGRSDYPNQINNTLCFPGIFRGALDSRARVMNEEMKLAAARALAEVIPEEDLSEDYIIPSLFDERIVPTMAEAVQKAAHDSGAARPSLEEKDIVEAPPP
jgi:malate dehydrogenase (oxaloacetate-decarboxylating)